MQINVQFPQFQTLAFAVVFITTLVLSTKKHIHTSFFPKSLTDELKGLAIILVVFSHIGYFLSADDSFLFPLSVFAGVGVNLFLFLSGYGLMTSSIKNKTSLLSHESNLSLVGFYKKKLLKIFFPLWVVLSVLLLLDWQFGNKIYPISTVVNSFLGWFPSAEIYQDLNSPLWYFSLILFYYLIFPLVSFRWLLFFSPGLILFLSYLVVGLQLPVKESMMQLYKLHLLAFPLGMVLALTVKTNLLKKLIKLPTIRRGSLGHHLAFVLMVVLVSYTAIYSGVGEGLRKEQLISLIITGTWIGIFLLKPFRFNFLTLLGVYSYEIYLIHWPILYRYDFLYKMLPPFLATFIYLFFFIGISFLVQKLAVSFYQKVNRSYIL